MTVAWPESAAARDSLAGAVTALIDLDRAAVRVARTWGKRGGGQLAASAVWKRAFVAGPNAAAYDTCGKLPPCS